MNRSVRSCFISRLRSPVGGGLAEFAILIPLVLCLAVASINLIRMVQVKQLLSSVSREGANAAYRTCAKSSGSARTSCLEALEAELTAYAQSAIPGAEIILSIYQRDTLNPTQVTRVEMVGAEIDPDRPLDPAATPVGRHRSKIQASTFKSLVNPTGEAPITTAMSFFTTAEVFYTHIPFAESFTAAMGITRRIEYEVTLF